MVERTAKLMNTARVTLTEHLLLDGAVLSTQPASYKEGLSQINEQIVAMSSLQDDEHNNEGPQSGKFTMADLNAHVWQFSQMVTQGNALQMD